MQHIPSNIVYHRDGKLLDSDCQALVNTVNCRGVMGKGVAIAFRKAYPQVFRAYRTDCDEQLFSPGDVRAYTIGDTRFVLCAATKNHWRNPSRYLWVVECLSNLVYTCDALKIQSVALPYLGCGNGGLYLGFVQELIWEVAQTDQGSDIEFHIYTNPI
jgi:O-acetyl-ADP-ribose deacetylase (regulator of RNase III)